MYSKQRLYEQLHIWEERLLYSFRLINYRVFFVETSFKDDFSAKRIEVIEWN